MTSHFVGDFDCLNFKVRNDSPIILDQQLKKCQILYAEWVTEVSELCREALGLTVPSPSEIMLCFTYHYKVFTLNFSYWLGVETAQKYKQVSLAADFQVHSWGMIHERQCLNRCPHSSTTSSMYCTTDSQCPPRWDLCRAAVLPASCAGWRQWGRRRARSGPGRLAPSRQKSLIVYLDLLRLRITPV